MVAPSQFSYVSAQPRDDIHPWPLMVIKEACLTRGNHPQDFPHLQGIEDNIVEDCPEVNLETKTPGHK